MRKSIFILIAPGVVRVVSNSIASVISQPQHPDELYSSVDCKMFICGIKTGVIVYQ